MAQQIGHGLLVISAMTLSCLAFWGIVVVDARRVRLRLVADIRSGAVPFFVSGGVVYHDAQSLDGSDFIAARPVHTDGDSHPYTVLDPRDIVRGVPPAALGLPQPAEAASTALPPFAGDGG